MTSWWWSRDMRQNARIAEAHGEAEAAQYRVEETAAQMANLSVAVHRRMQELELRVALLTELLEASGAVDRHVLDLRVEARIDQLRAASAGPARPCISCGEFAEVEAAITPFGPVCARCDGDDEPAPPDDAPYR